MRELNHKRNFVSHRKAMAGACTVLPSIAVALILLTSGKAFADLIEDIDELEKPRSPVTESPTTSATPNPGSGTSAPVVSPRPINSPKGTPGDGQQTQPTSKAGAPNSAGTPGSEKREPVYFESNGLQGQRSQGLINLLDKVVVTQGDMRLEADKATVHFDQTTEEVSKVIALGNVKILRTDPETKQKVRAESNEVLFNNLERKVTLKGNARLWRGGDLVRGKQIVYELDTGWIKADRVEGVVQPAESDGTPKANQKSTPKSAGKPEVKSDAKPASTKKPGKGT